MKLNEITNQHAEIEALLTQYKIKNYTIQPDGTVDVDGDVDLSEQKFTQIPIRFGKVTGDFDCDGCAKLTSLVGAPSSVGRNFICSYCPKLTSLSGSPSSVGRNFNCSYCATLTSLAGAPSSVVINFSCYSCPKLTTLEGFGSFIGGTFYCNWSNIKSGGISLVLSGATRIYGPTGPFEIINKYIGRPEDIFECQAELIAAGYEAYAKL